MTWPPPDNFTVEPESGLVRLGRITEGQNDDLGYWEEQLRAAKAHGAVGVLLPTNDGGPFWLRLAELCADLGLPPSTV